MPSQPEIVLSLIQLVGLSLPTVGILLQVAGPASNAINKEFDSTSGPFLAIRWSFIPLVISGALLLLYVLTYSLLGTIWIFHSAIFTIAVLLLVIFILLISLGIWFMSGLGLVLSYKMAKTEFQHLIEDDRNH
ncbi:hypothetical protein [Salinigranum sp. GCM10025319]|uniref:hypothetical protein n=1 Tax=Salinigranum sp. GCM10025319 TaxID=3252687 RepID=UPI0036120EF3